MFTFLSPAALPGGRIWPHANALVLVKVQTGSAGILDGLPVDAVVENVADTRVRMREEAVASRAVAFTTGWL